MEKKQSIAKNTIYLYARMLLIMVVSLFTSRVVLQVLGVEDYGIYNVVGGLVSALNVFTSTISAGTSRYFAFHIGRGDDNELSNYFRLSMTCFVILAFAFLLIAETVGLWFFNNKLNISPERFYASSWVYQCAVISLIINLFVIPHQSMIIAQENMSIYAIVGIVEVVSKLLIVYALLVAEIDKLILYSVLNTSIVLSILLFYGFYCRRKYGVCRYGVYLNKDRLKEFVSYSVWILFGGLSDVFKNQAVNVLINMFFGAVVNAARGIAYQINTAVVQFVNNFYMAVRPQITKRYASGERESMFSLVFSSSRLCFYLVLIWAIPLIIEMPIVLKLWLNIVPSHTILFARLVLIHSLVEALAYPLDTSISSTGQIKGFQFFVGGMLMLNLPVSYLILKLGAPAEATMVVMIVIAFMAHVIRLFFAHKHAKVSVQIYVTDVLLKIGLVSIAAALPQWFLYERLIAEESLVTFIICSTISILWTFLVIYLIGVTRDERCAVNNYLMKILKK